ncbi:hypothetical protein A2U01_0020961, partial [Trifolium medium]|nr:hypothetical protein [Trifolium medium]
MAIITPDASIINPTPPPTPPPGNQLVFLNVGSQIYIKLNGENYLAWLIQFRALLTGYDLLGYVDGTKLCPSQTLPNAATTNPAYTHWIRQDQLILHAIISSVAATVVTHLGTVTNAKQAWDILKTMYAGKSRIRIMALKQRISTFGKGTQSMAAYLQGIKAIAEELFIIDNPLDSTDLVIHTLNGLTTEYREIAVALRSRESPIEFAELHEKLMDFDMLLHREEPAMSDPPVVTANAASRFRGQQHQSRHNGNRTSHTSAETNESQVVCQYCGKPGHIARNCFKIKGYPRRNGGRAQDG